MNNGILTTQGGGLSFDSKTNHAKDDKVREWCKQNLFPVVEYARYDRQTLEEEWREIRRMVLLKHDGNQKYIGRSQAYIPAYAKARDTVIANLAKAAFPSSDYLSVMSRKDQSLEENIVIKDYIQHEFESQMRLRSNIKPFISQFVDYGWSVAKHFWEPGDSYKPFKLKKTDTGDILARGPGSKGGSRFSVRSCFSFYLWPTTIDHIDEATVAFEDIDITLSDARALERKGLWVDIELAASQDGRESMHDFNIMQQQTEIMGTPSNPRTSPSPGGELSRILTAKECYLDMPMPDSAYTEDEVKGEPIPVKVTFIGDVVVEARRNPFWHQKKPYLAQRMRTFVGSFYPKGTGHMARYLQYLLNDFTNQLNDNGTYALNPVTLVNPSTMSGPLTPIRPGVVWQTTDPVNGIKFDRPPVEQLQYGKMLADGSESKLYDVTGAPPIMQGTNAAKGARTATSSQILQSNASTPVADVVEDMENDVLVPAMRNVVAFGQQFRSETLEFELDGKLLSVDPEDFDGEMVYKFLASTQAANQQQRGQQAMMLLQILPALIPLLQAAGKIADPTPLLRRIYTDAFGFRNFEEFVKAMAPQVPGAMPGAVPPEGGEPAPGENAGESAIPESEQSVEGEGAEGANVRDNADILSALGGLTQ